MFSFKRTKIIATLGPTSSTEKVIAKLISSGLDVARLNFSHGTHEDHKKRVDIVRSLSEKTKKPIAIIQDLQGPKIRLGILRDVIIPKRGSDVVLFYGIQQTDDKIPVAS